MLGESNSLMEPKSYFLDDRNRFSSFNPALSAEPSGVAWVRHKKCLPISGSFFRKDFFLSVYQSESKFFMWERRSKKSSISSRSVAHVTDSDRSVTSRGTFFLSDERMPY